MSRFIKYNPDSEMSIFLQSKPIANHLASIIATRARRKDCLFTGLKIGECYLGDYKKIGLSEQQYRTAKNTLKRIGLATFQGTNKGTVAKLVSIDVWDLNVEAPNGQTHTDLTKQQRLTKNEKNKRTKEVKESNLSETLKLAFEEYLKLRAKKKKAITTPRGRTLKINRLEKYVKEHGEQKTIDCINLTLDNEYSDIKMEYLDNKKPQSAKCDNSKPQKLDLEAYLLQHYRPVDLKHMKKDGRFQRWEAQLKENSFRLCNIAKGYKNEHFSTLFLFEALFMPLGSRLGGSNDKRKLESLQKWFPSLSDNTQNKGEIRKLLKERNKNLAL